MTRECEINYLSLIVRLRIICILNPEPRSHSNTPHTVSAGRAIGPSLRPLHDNTQTHKRRASMLPGSIRTRNPRNRAAPGTPRESSGPRWKILRAPHNGGPAKNPYVKSERLNVSCRVTCVSSERFSLYSRHIINLPRNSKTYVIHLGLGPTSGLPGQASVIWTGTAAADQSLRGHWDRLHTRTHSQAVDSLTKNYVLCLWLYPWFGGN